MFFSFQFVFLSSPSVVTPTCPVCGINKDCGQNNLRLNLLCDAICTIIRKRGTNMSLAVCIASRQCYIDNKIHEGLSRKEAI